MNYKPKYCCHCGEKVERTKWTIFSSRRFCQLCETDFVLQEWTPYIAALLLVVLVIAGFSGYSRVEKKPLAVISAAPQDQMPETRKTAANQSIGNQSTNEKTVAAVAKAASQNAANTIASAPHQNTALLRQDATAKSLKTQTDDNNTTYFCGAATKKGTPCSRRVKGGGRCWQHSGQLAVLPPDKLIAN